MKLHHRKWQILLNAPLEEVWDFFSRPENLEKLTSEEMSFEIVSDVTGKKMYPGMFIEYRVKPFPWKKIRWVTEITEIDKFNYFIDEQRIGPYKIWHHEHHFEKVEDGILMTDILYYALPFGLIGDLANTLFVKNKVANIFSLRTKKIKTLFS